VLPQQITVTKDELLKAVWPDSVVEESNLTRHVFRLRKALRPQVHASPYIVTVPGQGYQFSAVVESEALLAIAAPIGQFGCDRGTRWMV
jgi:DNA-binding winged helix-turn-helix (wHTH) protein